MTVATEQDQVLAELRQAQKLLLTTHENPDGDALGSLLGMHLILEQLGKDSLMYVSPDEFPLPWEYRNWTFDNLIGAPPDDLDERAIVFLDCGNIDHHHDNTRFGTVNLVVPDASCTAEIVWHLSKELGVDLTPEIAEPLYTGLVTDTGRFMYENTGVEAHRMAVDLITAGVEPRSVSRRLYEDLPFSRLELLQRALATVERHDHGALTVAHLVKKDYEETGALETDSEGVIDHLRAVQGTQVAALVRELLGEDRGGLRKVSLRATSRDMDVSRIARAYGGGGHTQAAGFTTDIPYPELVEGLRKQVCEQLAE